MAGINRHGGKVFSLSQLTIVDWLKEEDNYA